MIPALLLAAATVVTNANGMVTCSSPYADSDHLACTGISFTLRAELREAKPSPSGRKPGLHRITEINRRRRLEAAQTNRSETATKSKE